MSRYCTLLLGLLYVAKDQAGVFISSLIENYLRLGALLGKSQLVDIISEAQTCFYVIQAILHMRSLNPFFNQIKEFSKNQKNSAGYVSESYSIHIHRTWILCTQKIKTNDDLYVCTK